MDMHEDGSLAGLRCLGHTRSSTSGQAEHSNEQQEQILKRFALEHDMVWVGVEHARGVSGSKIDGRDDIERLFERAQSAKDFDVLLVQSYDRLTRGGADHGGFLLFKFAQLGVRVVSATNDISDNEYAPLLRMVEFIKAQGTGKAISLATTRGTTASIFDGRMTYTRTPPYGIDRLVLSPSGEKLFRLRNLTDGSQVRLHWQDDQVLERFPPNIRNEAFRHFQKHVDQRIVLVPGAPEAVEAVKWMFQMYWVQGVGTPTLACLLDDRGVVPQRGGLWNTCSVYGIVHNPIYVQRGLTNQRATGLYHLRPNKAGVSPVDVGRVGPKKKYRPVSDWVTTAHPEINIIPADLREVIWEKQLAKRVRRAEADRTVDRKRVTLRSKFPLVGCIWDKATGLPMTGTVSGPESLHRYYFVPSTRTKPQSIRRGQRKFFPADALDRTVLEQVAVVLSEADRFVDELGVYVQEQCRNRSGQTQQVSVWKAERERWRESKAFALDEFNDLGPELLRKKTAPMTAKIRELDDRIKAAEQADQFPAQDPEDIVSSVMAKVREVPKIIGEAVPATLRSLLNLLVRVEVDLDARAAVIEVRLPDRVFARPEQVTALCGITEVPRRRINPTQPENAFILAQFTCKRITQKRHPCLECVRKRPAA